MQNENPVVHAVTKKQTIFNTNDEIEDSLTAEEIFDLIKDINDPEHPLSLQQLNVVQEQLISIEGDDITVCFTPTIPHCSMATLIGLSIRVQLLRTLPQRYKMEIKVTKGTHQSELQVNKQLNDKERVAAALENNHLLQVVNQCLRSAVY
jgi:metal-sulfur cluster biosynthetic enzyme